MPRAFATSLRAPWGFCVGAQHSQAPSPKEARAAGGSIGTCAWCGVWYSASTLLAADARAPSASPFLRATCTESPVALRSDSLIAAWYAVDSYDALSPRFHETS